MKRHLRFIAPVALCFLVVAVAYAGGWATITVNDLPDYAVAGTPITLTFSVRQHGMSLLSGLKPSIRAVSSTGLKAGAAGTPTRNKGEYTASLVPSQPGEWTITIDSGFNASETTLPMLKVIQPGTPEPRPFSDGTRGGRLFVAKGCIGCHRHQELNPERSSVEGLDLTTRRFPHDYLKRFLADPSIKKVDMPNLHLKDNEIAALAAFINKYAEKKTR